ncbi:hypothetical protein Hs20B_09090 [Lactococcus insecticola]|uniref:LysM domain-containing protein n=2 Tax=Pseudolactococcus insecticola TaxID=2709158 RepID=A0A6A0B7T1_9LACT|nr:hypothetical protein Hs20B_09090 [Lactococcus insecticola]
MLGLAFGISVFLVLGGEDKSKADTQPSHKKQAIVEAKSDEPVKTISASSEQPSASSVPSSEVQSESEVDLTQDNVSYTVKSGDSLSLIADKYQVSPESIVQQNNLSSQDAIYAGQVLAFTRSYIVKAVSETESETTTEQATDTQSSTPVSINNGNKVAAGGLSDAERANVLSQLESRTGVPASQWDYIISRESGWIPSVKNSIGYYGLFQLAPGYQGYGGDVQSQIEGAMYLFNNGGMAHWSL